MNYQLVSARKNLMWILILAVVVVLFAGFRIHVATNTTDIKAPQSDMGYPVEIRNNLNLQAGHDQDEEAL